MPTQIVVFYACSLFTYVICLEIIYIVPLLRCMYTMRNAPRGGMEGLITSDLNGKVFKNKTDLGEFQIHDFRIF